MDEKVEKEREEVEEKKRMTRRRREEIWRCLANAKRRSILLRVAKDEKGMERKERGRRHHLGEGKDEGEGMAERRGRGVKCRKRRRIGGRKGRNGSDMEEAAIQHVAEESG